MFTSIYAAVLDLAPCARTWWRLSEGLWERVTQSLGARLFPRAGELCVLQLGSDKALSASGTGSVNPGGHSREARLPAPFQAWYHFPRF